MPGGSRRAGDEEIESGEMPKPRAAAMDWLPEFDGDAIGSHTFFAAAGLIDVWIVTVVPVMLGGGVPLLPTGGEACRRLELAETRTLPGGLVQLHFCPRR
jgi:hypothetical protein